MKIKYVHWWEDSSGRKTCHWNISGASFSESFVGELKGNDIDGWYYKEGGNLCLWIGPFKSMYEAKEKLMTSVGGVILNNWD